MCLHATAALSLNKRRQFCRRVVAERWTLTKAAAAVEVIVCFGRKWVRRFLREVAVGLLDRSWAPAQVAHGAPEDCVQAFAALRRLRFPGS